MKESKYQEMKKLEKFKNKSRDFIEGYNQAVKDMLLKLQEMRIDAEN